MKVLVTGATGKVGTAFIKQFPTASCDLIRIATPDRPPLKAGMEWVKVDFCDQVDFQSLVLGIDVIFHLAAEIRITELMNQVNNITTQRLSEAAEKAGVRLFIYTSSTMVYGYPLERYITEESVCVDQAPFPFDDYLSNYGKSKFYSELAITKCANNTKFIILRPTMLINSDDLDAIRNDWSFFRKLWWSHRYTHMIHVDEVARCLNSFLLEFDSVMTKLSSKVTVLNFSADAPDSTFGAMRLRHSPKKFLSLTMLPLGPLLDRWKDKLKYKKFNAGWPYGCVYFSGKKYEAKFGKINGIS